MNNRRLPHALSVIAFGLLVTVSGLAAEGGFRAGAARRDVTPREPAPMWGYGARHDALSEGALDPLLATAVVIEAGGRKLAIVGLDLGRSPSERSLQNIRKRIRAAGIEHSFIAGSHTHHGPVLELSDEPGKGKGKFDAALRYYDEMEEAVAAAILEADSRLAPAKIAAGSVVLDGLNRNRHTKIDPKPVERDLSVLRLDDLSGKRIAAVVNFAAHPTMLPAATLKFSADYIGSLRETVEAEFGGRVVFMQGAAGDQSVNAGENKGHQAYGAALGRAVVKLLSGLETQPVGQPSREGRPSAPASLDVREERFTFASRNDFSNQALLALFAKAFFPELIPNYVDEYADGIRPRLTVALLNGEIAMVGVSGEFFAAHSIRLKKRARVKQTFFFGYCNGYHQYFPTIEAVAEGGYGADSRVSPVAVGAGERLMDTALVWLYQMLGKIKVTALTR